jgi:hypothetical protein
VKSSRRRCCWTADEALRTCISFFTADVLPEVDMAEKILRNDSRIFVERRHEVEVWHHVGEVAGSAESFD